MKTGIFGGSFNPIHKGHIALASALLRQAHLDEIWFVVSPQNPLKQDQRLMDDDVRLQIVRKALARSSRLVASDYEFHLPRPSYMHTTLTRMSEEFPDREFTLIIGGDNWEHFDRWYKSQEIIDRFAIAVYPRAGSQIDRSQLPPTVSVFDVPLLDVSSTEIRRRIAQGLPIADLVPRSVERMILRYYSALSIDVKNSHHGNS